MLRSRIDIMKKLGFLLDFHRNSNTLRYSGRKEVAENRVDIGEYSSKHSRSLINLYPIFSRYGVGLKNHPVAQLVVEIFPGMSIL